MIEQSINIKDEGLFDRILVHTATVLFIIIFVSVTMQVLLRELPVQSSANTMTEPLSRYLLIVGTYIGAAIATRNNEHVRMSYFINRLELRAPRLHKVIRVVGILATITFIIAIIYAAFIRLDSVWGRPMGASLLDMGYLYSAIILSFTSMLIFEMLNIKDIILDKEEE